MKSTIFLIRSSLAGSAVSTLGRQIEAAWLVDGLEVLHWRLGAGMLAFILSRLHLISKTIKLNLLVLDEADSFRYVGVCSVPS